MLHLSHSLFFACEVLLCRLGLFDVVLLLCVSRGSHEEAK